MITFIEPLLTAEELKTVRTLLAESNWSDGRHTAGPLAALAKNNSQLDEQAAHLPELRSIVMQALSRSALFFSAALPLKILPPFFNCYSGTANTYGPHVDNALRRASDANGSYLRIDLSATLFLSEPDTYQGGELKITDTFGTHSVKMAAGSLVLYPSSSVHQVTPVTRGERLASFMFIQSLIRDDSQRRLLYDMDMALMDLRQTQADSAPVVQLTGTYHNLLRQWAET
jgi:PKHD-type hydroxylase